MSSPFVDLKSPVHSSRLIAGLVSRGVGGSGCSTNSFVVIVVGAAARGARRRGPAPAGRGARGGRSRRTDAGTAPSVTGAPARGPRGSAAHSPCQSMRSITLSSSPKLPGTSRTGRPVTPSEPVSRGAVGRGVAVTGIRRVRYRGVPKTRLEHVYSAVALNLIRLYTWWVLARPGPSQNPPPHPPRPPWPPDRIGQQGRGSLIYPTLVS